MKWFFFFVIVVAAYVVGATTHNFFDRDYEVAPIEAVAYDEWQDGWTMADVLEVKDWVVSTGTAATRDSLYQQIAQKHGLTVRSSSESIWFSQLGECVAERLASSMTLDDLNLHTSQMLLEFGETGVYDDCIAQAVKMVQAYDARL